MRKCICTCTHINGALVVGESLLGQNEHPVLVVGLREARNALRALPETADFDTSLTSAQPAAALRHVQALVQVRTLRTRAIHSSTNFSHSTQIELCEQLRALCAF